MPRGLKGEKRPADVIGAAVMVGRIATGEIEEGAGAPPDDGKDPAAGALGRKGGAARAAGISSAPYGCADVDRGLRVSRTAAGICLLLTYGTNEHVQSWDGEFPFVVDQIALKETRNGFRILVSQRTSAEQSR